MLNLRHRLSIAWGAFWRLYHMLRSRALPLTTKLRLWNLCVFSIARYSLCQVGMPTTGPLILRQAVHRQIRLIAKSPAHIHHETSEALLARLHIVDPWDLLCQQFAVRTDRPSLLLIQPGVCTWVAHLATVFMPANDKMHHPPPGLSPSLPHTSAEQRSTLEGDALLLKNAASQRSERSVFAHRTLQCPECQQTFQSLGALRVHISVKHKGSHIPPDASLEVSLQAPVVPDTDPSEVVNKRRNVEAHSDDACMQLDLPSAMSTADAQTRFAWLHSTQGLCICRHCGRECYCWDDLKVHIFTRACPQLFPDTIRCAPPADVLQNRLPLYWQLRSLLQCENRSCSWEEIAKVIKRGDSDLLHRCPICDQWLVKARGLGHHLQAFHSYATSALQTARQRAREVRKTLALGSQCRYCSAKCSGHPTKHAAECPAILLSRCLQILLTCTDLGPSTSLSPQEDGPGADLPGGVAGGGRRLAGAPDGSAHGPKLQQRPCLLESAPDLGLPGASETGGLATHRLRNPTQVQPGTARIPGKRQQEEGPPQLPGTSPGEQSPKQRPLRFFWPQQQDDNERPRAAVQHGHSATPARGSTEYPQTVHCHGGLPRNGTPPHHCPDAPQSGRTVEGQQGGRSNCPQASDQAGAFPGIDHGTQTTSLEARILPDLVSGCAETLDCHGARSVSIPGVEQNHQSSGDRPKPSAPGTTRRDPDVRRADDPLGAGWSASQVSSYEGPGACHGGTHSDLDDRAGSSQSQIVSHLGAATETLGVFSAAPHCGVSSTRKNGALHSCSESGSTAEAPTRSPPPVGQIGSPEVPEAIRVALRKLKLGNRSNECYANSVLLASLWTTTYCASLEVNLRPTLVRGLVSAFQGPTVSHHLWSTGAWARLFQQWPHEGRQQDAADFLTFLRQQSLLSSFGGQWLVMHESQLTDAGSLCPIILQGDLPKLCGDRQACRLQEIVDAWHLQSGSPALYSEARCVALQLNRFQQRAGVAKCRSRVALPLRVHLPCWVEGVIRLKPFLVRAALIHLGESTRNGHYRSVLFETSGRCWYTDDYSSATNPSLSDARVFQENVYVIFLSPASSR